MDHEKGKAIYDMTPPRKLEELRRSLGLVNYVTKFVPKAAEVRQPLHNLLRKDVERTWTTTQPFKGFRNTYGDGD